MKPRIEYSSSVSLCYPINCRYCHCAVFYVEHNGGRVLFDKLGQPWPKHECTPNINNPFQLTREILTGYHNLGHVLAIGPEDPSVSYRLLAVGLRDAGGAFQKAICLRIDRRTSLQIDDLIFVSERRGSIDLIDTNGINQHVVGRVKPSAMGIKKFLSSGKILRAPTPR